MPTPFIAPGSDIPITEEEIEFRKRKAERLKEIGINPYKFGPAEDENPYRVQAMILINQDKEVPEELLYKIEKYNKKHKIG